MDSTKDKDWNLYCKSIYVEMLLSLHHQMEGLLQVVEIYYWGMVRKWFYKPWDIKKQKD